MVEAQTQGVVPGHNIIVVGASAGGLEALTQLVAGLPLDLPATVFVVLHFPSHGTSTLPKILSRSGVLPATHPEDGEAIQTGRIYVAPPDYHLLIKRGHVRIVRGPRENSHRPAIDPLFRTAARAYGPQVVGVVLSGVLDDGTAGLSAIKIQGGVAVVQDPDDALYPGMPESAIANVKVDHILPSSDLVPLLVNLASKPVTAKGVNSVSNDMASEADIAELDLAALQRHERPGTPSGFACPECGGALWELSNGDLIRFRCRVGHAMSAESLLAEQSEAMEAALWSALRALEESAALAHRLAERAYRRNHPAVAERFEAREQDAAQSAILIRQAILKGQEVTSAESAGTDPVSSGAEDS